MKFLIFLRGYVRLTVTGASPQDFFNRLAALGVTFWDAELIDDFTAAVSVYPHALSLARRAAERCQCQVEASRLYGFRAVFYGLRRRPVLVGGLVLAVLLAQFLSGRIWDIQVQGCETYHPQEILRALEELGVGFGTASRGLDAQRLETKMKLRLDRLEWFTINIYGTRAQVIVQERRETPQLVDPGQICNIVAAQAGLITQMRVYAGAGTVEPGQAVTAGQLLVSGVVDHPTTTQLTHALGEIFARTWRRTQACAPLYRLHKTQTGQTWTRYGLILGKKRFNFGQNSGIPAGVYDKITEAVTWTLPGGLVLPVTFLRETVTVWETDSVQSDPEALEARLKALTEAGLLEEMDAGTILQSLWTQDAAQTLLTLNGLHACTEQIGRTVPVDVQWMVSNTEDDGDNS